MKSMIIPMQGFNAVGAGQTANLSIAVGGYVYQALFLKVKHDPGAAPGTKMTAANFKILIESIKVKVNGDSLIDVSGAELLILNDFYGYPRADGVFPIIFKRPEFIDPTDEVRFALGTQNVDTVSVEVKLAAAIVGPELSMSGDVLVQVRRDLGQVVRIRGQAYGAQAAAGINRIQDLTVRGRSSFAGFNSTERGLKALHLTAANIADHKVILSGAVINEGEQDLLNVWADVNAFQTVSRSPQPGIYHIDFAGNRYSGIVPTDAATEFALDLNFSAANPAFSVIAEEIIGNRDI